MNRIIYLPIDERCNTRHMFLNLARLTPYEVLTPPPEMISNYKTPADLAALDNWIADHIKNAQASLISLEMYIYGGLVPSRIHNTDFQTLAQRLEKLQRLRKQYPQTKLYLSTVIQRIPAYSLSEQEPDYWEDYGAQIFKYSFHTHRYEALNQPDDLRLSEQYQRLVPDQVIEDFRHRREKNHRITTALLHIQSRENFYDKLYITIDDNAEYGSNKREENSLRRTIEKTGLANRVFIYPGADEVGLTMLANMAATDQGRQPKIKVVYRDESTKDKIPAYEAQPLSRSVTTQISAAGAAAADDTPNIILLINNCSDPLQKEAWDQQGDRSYNFEKFIEYLDRELPVACADLRYTNGADINFVKWLLEQNLAIEQYAYAGWNANSNSLGTAIANSVLLQLFDKKTENAHFNLIQLLDGAFYQAQIRTELRERIARSGSDPLYLPVDKRPYVEFALKRMAAALKKTEHRYHLPYRLEKIDFPWNRTYNIGMVLVRDDG